jgi:hypothetical protein
MDKKSTGRVNQTGAAVGIGKSELQPASLMNNKERPDLNK